MPIFIAKGFFEGKSSFKWWDIRLKRNLLR